MVSPLKRYFIEVAYHGKSYAGSQIQDNATTIQLLIEKALQIYFRSTCSLYCSSRTDAGVHAHQNFFHWDTEHEPVANDIYHLNALLPQSIAITRFYQVDQSAHARFSALSREYSYLIYKKKNPFLEGFAWYYPYTLDIELLDRAAQWLLSQKDFSCFSKTGSSVNHYICNIQSSNWTQKEGVLSYHVVANRFLRGMVKGMVTTMLGVARQTISLEKFYEIVYSQDPQQARFDAPSCGLYLKKVNYPSDIFLKTIGHQ
ncbi:MAG: tRNA pseudouridine(38-40) synthase TruA [Phycisphaerales bacterium]|nr:tRNA pseudouridine(38-40) synthase TruA [Phycisphaerales bacterium]